MTTILIVIGVILFLAIDAYVLYRVFASRRRAADYGAMPVPGEMELTLQDGRLKLTYQESYKAPSSEDSIRFGVPAELRVTVTGPAGEALELDRPGFRGMGAEVSTGRGWSRAVVGTVRIEHPGIYTVTADGAPESAVEPQLLAGP